MAGQKKDGALSALNVVVVGGTFEQRRAVGQMVFGGLEIMKGGLFSPQINCADALKSHVNSGDLAEVSGRDIDAIRLQLAAHATMQTDTTDAIDNFRPDQSAYAQPMDIAPYVEPTVAEKNLTRALTSKPAHKIAILLGDRYYTVDELNVLVESGNFSEEILQSMQSLLTFASIVARFKQAIKPVVVDPAAPDAGSFSLPVTADHGLAGDGTLFEEVKN